ncbi:hypothetical protein Tco_1482911 [Tanacetum coccineum]
MLPGENINEYYVRFHKLVNDMRNIRMTMPNIQLNSKFVNNLSPEWDRFVTAVKLNKGLKETNHEQLYAYLKQHEKHAAQDSLIIERITLTTNDPLAFINNQLRTLSNTRNQATVQDGRVVVQNVQRRQYQNPNQRNFARGNGASRNGGTHNRAGNANAGQGKPIKCNNCNGVGHIARNYTQSKRPQNSDYFKDKMLLMQAQENGAVLDEEELLFLVGEHANTFEADVDNQPVRDLALNEDNIFQADECDAFNSDVDDEPTVYCESSVPHDAHVMIDNDACVPHDPYVTELAIYKEQVAIYEQCAKFELTEREHRMYDQMRILIQERNQMEEKFKHELHSIKLQLNNTIKIKTVIQDSAQLTPKQVFWSTDLLKKRAEELKANTLPLPVLPPATVYPPNTPVHLVPRTLPTTSQVNIEVIPFFNLLKEHFDGVYKSLVTEVRAMKAVSKNMEAEVDQNAIDRKSGEIERKNLLITNDNLIANSIAQDMFYTVTDSALNASRFHDLSTAYNVAMTRAVELEAENSQNIENLKSKSSKDVLEFDAFLELGKRDDHIQCHKNTIRKLKAQISQLKGNKSDELSSLDSKSLDSQNLHLKETVTALQERIENFKAENEKSQELLANVGASCPKVVNKHDKFIATTPVHKQKHVTFADPLETSGNNTPKHVKPHSVLKTNVPILPSTGVNTATTAKRSQPKSNTTHNKTFQANSVPKKTVEEHPRTNKSKLSKMNRVDSSTRVRSTVLNTNSNSLCKTCNKCLISFNHDKCVETFLKSYKKHTVKQIWRVKQVKQTWKPTGNFFTTVGYHWKPTGRMLPLGAQCPLTRNTTPRVLHVKQWKSTGRILPLDAQCPLNRNTKPKGLPVVQIVLWYLDSGCSKHMTGDLSRLRNFVKKFIGTVRFGNDHFGTIMGYGDYVIGESVISRVWILQKITRKEPKPDKNRHEKERVHKSREFASKSPDNKECHVVIKQTRLKGKYYTESSVKEAQGLQYDRIATLTIRVMENSSKG